MEFTLSPWHIWVLIGLGLLILEIFTPGFFAASVAFGAFAAAIASATGASLTVQIVVLTLGTLITFIFIRPMVMVLYKKSHNGGQLTGTEALIGKQAMVTEKIVSSENAGRVKIGGELWKASSLSSEIINEGQKVIVEKIEGVTAFVKLQKGE